MKIKDNACKMLSTTLANVKSPINGSYFYYHAIRALNFLHFNGSEEGT